MGRFEHTIQSLCQSAVLVCQSIFLSLLLTAILYFSGLDKSAFGIALLGGILIFNVTLTYLRILESTHIHRLFSKCVVLGLCALVAIGGVAIGFGVIWQNYSIALQPIPILLLAPIFMTILQAADQAARARS